MNGYKASTPAKPDRQGHGRFGASGMSCWPRNLTRGRALCPHLRKAHLAQGTRRHELTCGGTCPGNAMRRCSRISRNVGHVQVALAGVLVVGLALAANIARAAKRALAVCSDDYEHRNWPDLPRAHADALAEHRDTWFAAADALIQFARARQDATGNRNPPARTSSVCAWRGPAHGANERDGNALRASRRHRFRSGLGVVGDGRGRWRTSSSCSRGLEAKPPIDHLTSNAGCRRVEGCLN